MLEIQKYNLLPLSFQINQGQSAPEVAFLARGSGYNIFFTPEETVLLIQQSIDKKNLPQHMKIKAQPIEAKLSTEEQKDPVVIRIKLDGANQFPQIEGLEELPSKVNYFRGNDPSKWYTNISTFSKIKYHDVYPGIDIVYYGNQGQLEHDYVISPGTDPSLITLDIQGVKTLDIDATGNLVLENENGSVYLKKPYIYQNDNGVKKEISGGYLLKNSSQVSFQVADYNTALELVIDPILEYSTYLGGSGDDQARSIAVDSSGNAYIAGYTRSTDFPTKNPIQANLAGTVDAFVTKINVDGSALLYSTYLGGSGDDEARSITVDSSGNAYISGYTNSTDFPTKDPIQANRAGTVDSFVTKINVDGSALLYSTYLGGSGNDEALSITVDSSGNAYVAGSTTSTDFPTKNPIQANFAGTIDAFVTKINVDGSALLYSTYIGGSNYDQANGITVDSSGNAYITGMTYSTDFPTKNPIQANYAGGIDVFVTKINADCSALLYSTYLGGSSYDITYGITVDSSGNAYVIGQTHSSDFPTKNPIKAYAGNVDAFVTKINTDGSALLYSTFLGGNNDDLAKSITVDSFNNAYVAGLTASTDFPTKNPIQANKAGGYGYDAFVTKINSDGSLLLYSTYLGGSSHDRAISITIDSSSNVYVAGYTQSTDFPTKNPIQANNAGGNDAFVCKISLTQLDKIEEEVSNIQITLDNPDYGLQSIKNGVSAIDNVVNDINTEVDNIEGKLDNPDFGLKSIKNEITSVKDILSPSSLTTGAVIIDKCANSIVIGILNDTSTIKTVTIYVYDIETSPRTIIFKRTVDINPNSSTKLIFPRPSLMYEVKFTNIIPGIYAWTATRKEIASVPLQCSSFISTNCFNHSQLVASTNS